MEDPDRPGDHACPHTLVTSIPDWIHKHKHTHNVNQWIEAYQVPDLNAPANPDQVARLNNAAASVGFAGGFAILRLRASVWRRWQPR